MPKKKGTKSLSDILVLLGAVISLIFGILNIVGIGVFGLGLWSIGGYLPGFDLIIAIILIIFSLITLATTEVIKFPWKFKKNWTMLLVLGIILLILGGGIGAVLVIIGAILLLF
ncbi:MAG: hypothetical protein ACXACA_03270 [Candidatus Ranarchaeia archaeon]|jgi:hypothetical protein